MSAATLIRHVVRWSKMDVARTLVSGCVLTLAVYLAYLVRFDWHLGPLESESLAQCLALMVPVQLVVLIYADFHRRSIRGLTLHDIWRLVRAVSGGSLAAVLASVIVGINIPRSIVVTDWFFAISMLGGLRALACEVYDLLDRRAAGRVTRVLLVGTCPSSEAIVRTINRTPSGRRVVGIAAPAGEEGLVGRSSGGVPVLGTLRDVERLIVAQRIDEVLLVSGSLVGRQARAIESRCAEVGCPVRAIPFIETLVDGGMHVQPRPLEIADLLKRDPVEIDLEGIRSWVGGATVLVTGAAGSIGSEICRQVAKHGPARILLVDRNENGLFWLERELNATAVGVEFVPCIADITDRTRIESIIADEQPAIVFHAAAYKHVPLMEQHPGEAVKNITLATAHLAQAAARHGVETFVLISTDKAVNPTSVMGSCKRVAEMLVQAVAPEGPTRFVAVRFGNVLDSAGSVVPLFREQILRGGPVTVTHPDIERFFMTIPEASLLVLQAGLMGKGGEVFVLDMGEPVRIADLAADMIRLSNLVEGRDIEIQYTGLRPGEKLYEELHDSQEIVEGTTHPKISALRTGAAGVSDPEMVIERLRNCANASATVVRELLAELVPGYHPAREPVSVDVIAGRIGPEVDAGRDRRQTGVSGFQEDAA